MVVEVLRYSIKILYLQDREPLKLWGNHNHASHLELPGGVQWYPSLLVRCQQRNPPARIRSHLLLEVTTLLLGRFKCM